MALTCSDLLSSLLRVLPKEEELGRRKGPGARDLGCPKHPPQAGSTGYQLPYVPGVTWKFKDDSCM